MMRQIATVKPVRLQHAIPPESTINGSGAVEMAPSITWAQGQALGRVTASGKYALYNDANSDGTQTCAFIAMFAGKTDAAGNVFLGDANLDSTSFLATAEETLQVYWRGPFFVADLVGVDAAAIADLGGRLIYNGTILYIP